ncbi:MFS transporter [Natronolimnohabitans innermongolicus]|uniref:Major facilitator superfamily protein n=1 Tax=Natronolimnohabitans innermongolicus JCM 12255 TaxID=1227499 RepID=L9WTG6_9EURY|nr:MFS transporter [Natronolimnohabitans innermongolicus]ELY51613.1 major facilitator superfamily protein [Natronolimnohabitans innermongolicus JCM 12255]
MSGTETNRTLVVGAVILSTFFVGFGGGVIFPILPNLGVVLGISPVLVGIILSANRFSRLVANAPAGVLVDRIGTRTPFVVGMLIQSVATFGYVVAMVAARPEFWFLPDVPEAWFLGSRLVWGLGSAAVFATAYTIAANVSDGGSRGANMGLIRGGVLFGFPSGIVIGGLITEFGGEVLAFAVATVFAILATAIAYASIPETHVDGDEHRSVSVFDVDTSIPALTVGLVNFAVLFAYIGALFATLVLFLQTNELSVFGFDAQASSGIFMAMTVVSAGVFMFLGGTISDRTGSRVPTLLCFLGTTFVGFVLLATADSVATLTAACLLIGAGQGGTSGPLMALLADLTPDDRMGRAVGTNNVLGDVGGGLGPIVSLPIVDVVGFGPVYLACAILPVVAGAILLGGLYRETGQFLPDVGYLESEAAARSTGTGRSEHAD